MNELIERQLTRRTIRQFTKQPVSPEIIDTLKKVAIQTATSEGMQLASVIRITDAKIRAELAQVCKQNYVNEVPEFWVFVVDINRNMQIASNSGVDPRAGAEMERFFQGYSDTVLMAQNVTNAIESFGMGACFFGSLQNDMGRVIKVLGLPKYTAPILGVGFGYPDQEPQLKPRLPIEMRFFENTYAIPENQEEILADYDQEMTTYYDLRDANRRVDSFKLQVETKFKSRNYLRESLVEVLASQGFNIQRQYVDQGPK